MNNNEQQLPKRPPFGVLGQFLGDLSFENLFIARLSEEQLKGNPQITVEADVNYQVLSENERVFKVTLDLMATAAEESTKLFIVEVSYSGIIQVSPEVEERYIEPILMIEAPNYLFVEARNIAAHIVWQGGYPPMMMQSIDFASLYQKKILAAEESKGH